LAWPGGLEPGFGGRLIVAKKFCTNCGDEVAEGEHFCGSCGQALPAPDAAGVFGDPTALEGSAGPPTEPVHAPRDATVPGPAVVVPAEPAPSGGGGWWSEPRNRIGAGVLALVAVLGLVVGVALAAGSGGGGTTRQVSKKSSAPTTTTLSPAVIKAQADYKDYVNRLENILQQSAAGRGQVGSLVGGVQNGCQVSPQDASAQIRTVIDNRTSVLNQLAGLSVAPNAEAQNLYSLLQQSLQSSINADTQYKAWMDYLYTDYYYTFPVGCPNGVPPHNSSFDSAQAADGNSTNFKTQFVNAFNPVATRFGLATVDAGSF
jgi:hypothetical protein